VALPVALAAALIGAWQYTRATPVSAPTSTPSATVQVTPTPTPTPTPSPTPPPLPALRFRATTITTKTEGFFSWALMDRRTGEIWGSKTFAGTTWPASMIKAWLAADYLRRADQAKKQPSAAKLSQLESLIRDSNNDVAEQTYRANGGNASIKRLISMCKLTDTKVNSAGWSFTLISARDTVRMADCIGDGTAAGDRWTGWLLDMMRKVRGEGDFGIRKALPAAEAAQVAIKNGWLFYDDDKNWHINCMALTDTWAMAVLQRYPGHGEWTKDYTRGRNVCRDVAKELRNPDYVPAAPAVTATPGPTAG